MCAQEYLLQHFSLLFVALFVIYLFPLECKWQVNRIPGCPGNWKPWCMLVSSLEKQMLRFIGGNASDRQRREQEAGRTVRPQCRSDA